MKNHLKLVYILIAVLASLPVFAQQGGAPDFGDYNSSGLTTKAWEALGQKNYALADTYANKCIEMYAGEAAKQQASLTAPAPKDKAFDYWALNDVGTCYFILGQSLEQQGKTSEALAAYKALVDKYGFAQCWDTKGWFWAPADAAKGRVKALEFEAM